MIYRQTSHEKMNPERLKLKRKARRLYETKRINLAMIADILEVNPATVRAWKHLDKLAGFKWNEPYKHRKRRVSENSLKNLCYLVGKNRRVIWNSGGYYGQYSYKDLLERGLIEELENGYYTIHPLN